MDETALRDLPAAVDYILSVTKDPKLSYIGFSQGAAEVLAALSMLRPLNEKLDVAILLAPTTSPKRT